MSAGANGATDPTGPQTWLIVGLGNPGPQYARTRHNIGQMVVDELAERIGNGFTAHKAGAAVATGRLSPGGPRVMLAKPSTYMNVSGRPTAALAAYYSVDPAAIVVVHDELDIPFDSLKLKIGGGEGGHNGLKSISQTLGTKDYHRVRVGVGRPPGRIDAADYVLRPFSTEERELLPVHLDRAADAVEKLITDGLTAAQNSVH